MPSTDHPTRMLVISLELAQELLNYLGTRPIQEALPVFIRLAQTIQPQLAAPSEEAAPPAPAAPAAPAPEAGQK